MKRFPFFVAAPIVFAASGCALNPRPVFDEAVAPVGERTGLQTAWLRSAEDERAALLKVRDLLREPLDPRRAAQVALLHNRGLQAKLEELGIANAAAAAKRLPGNPEFEAFIGWPSSPGDKKVELGFGTDILDLFLIPSRRKLATLELQQAKSIAAGEILDLAARAQVETIALQSVEADLRSLDVALEIEEALAEFAEARRAAGTLPDLEYEEELSKRDELGSRVARLRIEARRGRETLNRTLGLSGDLLGWTLAPLAGELPLDEKPADDLESLALARRFDIAAARSASELIDASLGLQKKTRLLPAGVHLGATIEKEGSARVAGPSVRLQLPLFNPGRYETARLEPLALQARRLREDTETRARAEVREALERMRGARDLARRQEEEVVPRRRRIVEMTLGHYNMMLRGADDLLRARRDEAEAELELNDARRAFWTARVELALALGGALESKTETRGEGR